MKRVGTSQRLANSYGDTDTAHMATISARERTIGKLKLASWLFVVDTTSRE